MELKKTLMASTLFSALILAGCGGGSDTADTTDAGDGREAPVDPGTVDPGPVDPPEFGFVDAYSAKISGDIQAAVKASTFVRYEDDVANYELAFDYVADYSSQLGEVLVEELNALSGLEAIALAVGVTLDGTCANAGEIFVKGSRTDINIEADQYCVQLKDSEENLTGDELTLSGDVHLIVDEPGYSLELTQSVIQYDAFDADITDVTVAIAGTVDYSQTNSGSQLAIDAEVTFDGFTGNYDFTQNCVNLDCPIDANLIPGDGNEYSIEGLTIILSNGYQGSADIFYDEALGKLAVSFEQIQYCADGTIGSGTMNILEKDGTGEIQTTFNGCGVDPIVEFYAEGAP